MSGITINIDPIIFQVGSFLVYSLLILVPFFLAGIILAQVFRMFASLSGKNLETLLKGEFL